METIHAYTPSHTPAEGYVSYVNVTEVMEDVYCLTVRSEGSGNQGTMHLSKCQILEMAKNILKIEQK